jgi:CDP-glucose 4,6-dehydratase
VGVGRTALDPDRVTAHDWTGRRVLVTGHTGFKGSWLALWLRHLGAEVIGLALDPPTDPSHYAVCGMGSRLIDLRCDIRDHQALTEIVTRYTPELVFHLAAQSIVRRAYADPRETLSVNVMGTLNVLEVARGCGCVRAVVVATSDKCYRETGNGRAYRETDPLGGHEPYSTSKACAEVVTEMYRQARFQSHAANPRALSVASVRAGNVIGGGDWGADRLVPDVMRAIASRGELVLRNPDAMRPWQHVLDCLAGYLRLGAQLLARPGVYEDAWNLGPDLGALPRVSALVTDILSLWPDHGLRLVVSRDPPDKEAQVLRLDSTKARDRLGWAPVWTITEATATTVAWYRRFLTEPDADMHAASLEQIEAFMRAAQPR